MNCFSESRFQFIKSLQIQLERCRINYDEKKVPNYTLPDPLKALSGTCVTCPNEWWQSRRPEVLSLFQKFVYGTPPHSHSNSQKCQLSHESAALSGLAKREEITIYLNGSSEGPQIHLLLYVPNHSIKPVPIILGLNFYGNHTIHTDPGISITGQWHEKKRHAPLVYMHPSEKTRGADAERWPVKKILQRGYGLATAYYGDLEPDYIEGYRYGIRSLILNHHKHKEMVERNFDLREPKERIDAPVWNVIKDWGAIGVWALGLSRIMDYLESNSDIQASQVVLFGHSRLGKTALWAGAQDNRFAIVISNNSGCAGAALSRRRFGETIRLLNLVRPHWFPKSFKCFNGKEDQLPVDQHLLIALMAPRPVYVASAEQDLAADPLGEFCSVKNADCVYELLGLAGLGVDRMPAVNKPVGETIGYHIRTGKHGVKDYDWTQFLDFADRHFGKNCEDVAENRN